MSKRQTSKILSLLLTVCLVLSTIPLTALAEDSGSNLPTESSSNELGGDTGSNEATLINAKGTMPSTPASPVVAQPAAPRTTEGDGNSGDCGATEADNVKWVFNPDTGTLTISGTGAMENYGVLRLPWLDHKEQITDVIVENGVTSIGSWAFYECSSLTNATIESSVTSIGNDAFRSCTSLTSISFPQGLTSIGYAAFSECSSLTNISLPQGLTSIGDSTFQLCFRLTSITIPNSVTSIGDYTFNGCTSLTSISLPQGLTSIGNNAFWGCSKLTNITIPNSVTEIGVGAFLGCSKLTNITIPNSVTEIGEGAFQLTGLTSITIPNSVTKISNNAFLACSNLTSITIPNSVTEIGEGAFGGCTNITSINFKGATPPNIDVEAFLAVPITGTVYYSNGATGYTTEWLQGINGLSDWTLKAGDGNGGNNNNTSPSGPGGGYSNVRPDDEDKKEEPKTPEIKPETTEPATKAAEVKTTTTLKIGQSTYTVTNADGTTRQVTMDVAPIIKDGRTLMPARFVANILGVGVNYDNASKKATFTYEDSKVELTLGQKIMIVNGQKVELLTAPTLVNGRILLPLRDIQQAFASLGIKVTIDWNAATKEITIAKY